MMDGWYGDRINRNGMSQLLQIYSLLVQDPDSRRAILTIHSSHEELGRASTLDTPCTLTIQFLIRDKKLDMVVNMRSNDVMLGTPQNFAMWTFFQRMLAAWLLVEPGKYYHNVGSFHLYERDLEKAELIIRTYGELTNAIPDKEWHWPITDPRESLRQCELFAHAERMFREQRIMATEKLENNLKNVLASHIVPYVNKKIHSRAI